MSTFKHLSDPTTGDRIQIGQNGALQVPDHPILPYIEGDGIGPDIWRASQRVFDAAVAKAYGGAKKIAWFEIFAGGKAKDKFDEWLPDDTVSAIREFKVAIKGPLTTPVGGGIRSLNVALRQTLDLYQCIRPVRWFEGVPSPVKHPEHVNMVIFRENTEDVYAGIEYESGSEEAKKVIDLIGSFGRKILPSSGIGIKPISPFATKRLVAAAIKYARDRKLPSVTLVHKGNIMKFTEGAFKQWGYDVAREQFPELTIPEADVWDKHGGKVPDGKIVIKDRIADAMLQQILLRPREYSVLALPNLNGDYISDALAAQVGGLGLAPGGNVGDEAALFEATHGTAPKYAGQDKVNPSSVILSGVMMLEHLGWAKAAHLIVKGIEGAITNKTVTYDLERQMSKATLLKCSEFGSAVIENME